MSEPTLSSDFPKPLPPWRKHPKLRCAYCDQRATDRYYADSGQTVDVPGGIEVTYDLNRSVLLCKNEACGDLAWKAWDADGQLGGMANELLRFTWKQWWWHRRMSIPAYRRVHIWWERKFDPDLFPPDDGSPSVYV